MKPKKYLSQFFLTQSSYLKKIADLVRVDPADSILEIGAGRGELTRFLLEKGVPLTCVEIDPQLCRIMQEKFSDADRIQIVCQDITKYTALQPGTVAVGNIPYHISFGVIEFLVKNRKKIKRALLTFQKEFAVKLAASPGRKEHGFIACFIQMYAGVRVHFTIPRSCFYPAPKVDSAVVEIVLHPKTRIKVDDEREFLGFLRNLFSQRRKKISNILANFYPHRDAKSILDSCSVSPDVRPEKVPLDKLACIFNAL